MLKMKYIAVAAILSLMSVAAHAEGYAGVKGGFMMVDLGGVDGPINGGFVFGTSRSGWGFEGEMTISVVNGEIDTGFGSADFDITTLAGYGAFRTPGDTYFKAKLGVLYEKVNAGSVDDSDTGASYGLGIGWRTDGDNMIELEYTIVEQDVNFLSFAILF